MSETPAGETPASATSTPSWKPFHESGLPIIANLKSMLTSDPAFWGAYNMAAEFFNTTVIPKNHDVIIAAWQDMMAHHQINDDRGVTASVLAQKVIAEEKEAAKKAAVQPAA